MSYQDLLRDSDFTRAVKMSAIAFSVKAAFRLNRRPVAGEARRVAPPGRERLPGVDRTGGRGEPRTVVLSLVRIAALLLSTCEISVTGARLLYGVGAQAAT